MVSLSNKTELPITGVYENLTFSKREVWAWYVLPIPANEFGVYPEEAGLPSYLKTSLHNLCKETKQTSLDVRILVSTPAPGQIPLTMVGVKMGLRNDQGEGIIPKQFDSFINLVADAPLNDYLSVKELKYWAKRSKPYNEYFGINLGFQIATTEQLVYTVRKRFYPGMEMPVLTSENADNGQWGEGELLELAAANINIFPKYVAITQEINNQPVTGYRTGIEIIKQSDEIEYPEFEAWLPFAVIFPFVVDFSVRFSVTETEYTNVITRLSIEAPNLDLLTSRVEDLMTHYQENDMYPVWTSGDQYSLLTESIPSGYNIDDEQRSRKSELSITNIVDYLTFSKQDVYAWVSIPLTQFEFLDDDSKLSLVHRMNNSLAGLLVSEEKNVECHMIIQGTPFNSREWVKNLNEVQEHNPPHPYNRNFLTSMYQYVNDADFRTRTVLLGVNLGRRVNYAPNKSVTPTMMETILNLIPPPVADELSKHETDYWMSNARPVISALISSLGAKPASAEELAFSIRKNFFPDMPLPSPSDLAVGMDNTWDKNDIAYLADCNLENHSKYLKITQNIDGEEVSGYRATLCFSRFPDTLYFPQGDPWIHYASLLPFPTDFSLRFTVEPSRKVRKEVGKKLKEIIDQANNMESAGGNRTIEVEEHLRAGEDLDYELKKDPSPWVFGRYRITVEASTVEELKERARQIIDHYRALEIYVTWPTGDQLSLLKEGLPNDYVRSKAYYHRHILPIIAAGIPAGTGTAGDRIEIGKDGRYKGWIGAYQGYTTGSTQEPVFYDMHSTIGAGRSNSTSLVGSPGSGKTFFGSSLTYQSVLYGAWTIYIDPKADASGMVKLPGLENAKVFDLRQGHPGILDPFTIGRTLAERKNLTLETIYLFLGGMNSLTSDQQSQLAQAVDLVAEARVKPTLMDVVKFLEGNRETRNLGTKLAVLSDLQFSQLCFAPAGHETIHLSPEDGLTIFQLLGLKLPSAGEKAEENSQRLALGIMNLLVEYTSQLIENADKNHPKTLVIDEAWAIISTRQGVELVKKFARMGRAHNISLLLISQNSEDLAKEGVSNSISTRFAFRADDKNEALSTLSFLGLEQTDSNIETLKNLRIGECLMRDWSGRIARVQIDGWSPDMAQAFETNPTLRIQAS